MTYKDTTPTFNHNRKVVNFKDFINNKGKEEAELKKMKRQSKPNSIENQQLIGNPKTKYNKVTHKLDTNLDPNMIDDKLDSIESEN